jgi:hypothetical protein
MNLWNQFIASPHKPEWLQAIAAIATLLVTASLAGLTWYYVKVTAQQVKANILTPLLVEYGSEEIGRAIRQVRAWRDRYGYNFFDEAFARALVQTNPADLAKFDGNHEEAMAIDVGARRLLSQYFFRVRALCEHELVDRALVARVLGPEPIELYLEVIDKFDQAQRRALHRPPTKRTREFFESLKAIAPDE